MAESINDAIARSSIGRGLANIRENGIDAELADLEAEMRATEPRGDLLAPRTRRVDPRTTPARFSHLRAAGWSGAHALQAFQDESNDTLARRLGSGTHAMLLGKPWATWEEPSDAWIKAREKALAAGEESPPITYAPRSGKKWAAFQAEHRGSVILTRKEVAKATAMVDAIRANGPAARLLAAPGLIMERTILWRTMGRDRRSTPDAYRIADAWGPSFNVEIKTTRCAAPFVFWRDAKKLSYHAQLADQAAAIEAATGKPPSYSYIIAVESAKPHVVQVYEVPPKLLELGAADVRAWSERLQIFEATDTWSGYSTRVEHLEFLDPIPLLDVSDAPSEEGDGE